VSGSRRRGDRLPDLIESTIRVVLDRARLGMTDGREEVERELRAHFEDGLATGASPDDLVRSFGDPEAAGKRIAASRPKAAARNRGEHGAWWRVTSEWRSEVVRAARRLARAPAFSLIVIATLGLGVGANTGIFTVLHAVLLEDLPYPEPDRLVRIYEATTEDPDADWFLRAPIFVEYRNWADVFESVGALYTYRDLGADLTDGDTPLRVNTMRVSAGYFETLGARPELGRTFRDEESFGVGEAGQRTDQTAPVALLSHDLWTTQFGGDPSIVGRTVRLDDRAIEVVGVMPVDFIDPFGTPADVWLPQDLRLGGSNSFGNFYLSAVGRLRPGISLDQAIERTRMLAAGFADAEPQAADAFPNLVPLHEDVVGGTRARMLWLLTAAGILVLLTACLNVANLLLARGLSLDRPLALQSALGAGRSRLVAGILAENGILALAGGTLGWGVAWLGLRALSVIAPSALPASTDLAMGPPIFGFAMGVTALALLVFGLVPALRMSRTSPADVLRSGDRASTIGRSSRRLRDGLVVAQIATAIVLVTGAALLTRSFNALSDVPLAIEPEGVLTFEVHLPTARYPEGEQRDAFHRALHRAIRDIPSVEAVGATSWLPVKGRYHTWGLQWPVEGDPSGAGEWTSSDVRVIAGDYFEALGIDLLRGSAPGELDLEAEAVLWVNETLAHEVFGEVDPLGEYASVNGTPRRVAGIVEDTPFNTRGESSSKLYMPHAQYHDDRNWALIQTVRARGDLASVSRDLGRAIAMLDGQLVLYKPRTMHSIVAAERAQDRFALSLMGAFAGLALLLAVLGTYGVLAGSVGARTREIGIRMALGADTKSIGRMVLRYAMLITLPGIGLGLVGAWLASGWMDALLFGVEATSPSAYAASVLIFAIVAAAAGWIPARRATRVDTVRALAAE